MMTRFSGLAAALALLLLTAPAQAQDLKEAILGDLANVYGKTLALAETMPESSFDWRPGEGVRSFGEVLMHITAGNFVILDRIGAAAPDSVPAMWYQDPESVSGKGTLLEALRISSAWARSVVDETPVDRYGDQASRAAPGTSVISQILLLQTHAHEHLGQLIAYARTNGVAPPWSR